MAPPANSNRRAGPRAAAMSKSELTQIKAALRREAQRRRAEAARAAGDGPAVGAAIAERVQAAVPIPDGAVVSGYWPMRSEVDPRPLLLSLQACGHPLCLPAVVGAGQPLRFRAWRPGDALVAGGFGTQVPDAAQAERVPGLLLVPLLAFDRAGFRLGYGGGFYDRTLRALRQAGDVLAVGLAFAAQEVATVPHDAKDARLDWIVTEAEAIETRSE